MRLLNVNTLEFRDFSNAALPKYAIASHRWAAGGKEEEASMNDVKSGLNTSKSGYLKVKGFADYVKYKVDGVEWMWIDTCCINQESSQEVSEAINSMFKWYLNAAICLAYLEDVSAATDMKSFENSVWFTRGWTLQELLAPKFVVFLTRDWRVIGSKGSYSRSASSITFNAGIRLSGRIAAITRIPQPVLDEWTKHQHYSANSRLAWAKDRETTAEEDHVYCLLAPKLAVQDTSGEQLHFPADAILSRCISIPVPLASTHIDRVALSGRLESAIVPGKASTVVVMGKAGSGKSQLVRRYIAAHERQYDTVLWIDGSSKATVRSSFARCCRALSLSFTPRTAWGSLCDAAEVQAMTRWFDDRPQYHKWLLAIDGADDVSWDLDDIIPCKGTGNVVVTTNDFDALRQSCKRFSSDETSFSRVEVPESISTAAGVSLLYKHSSWEPRQGSEDFRAVAERIVRRLNNDLFSVDLAGAHIAANTPMADLAVRVRQYQIDSAQQRDQLQAEERYRCSGLREQAYWLAWETSMSPLRKVDPAQASMLPVLKLLALFPKGNVLDEMLRLAAIGLDKSSHNPRIVAPPLLSRLLALHPNGSWDSSVYHEAVGHLKRYNFVRETTGPWPGVTIHSVTRQQIKREDGSWQETWSSFVALLGAACRTLHETPAKHFEPHAILHLPSNKEYLPKRQHAPDIAFGLVCLSIGRIWQLVQRYDVAEDMLSAAHTELARTRGGDDRLTLDALEHLASNSRHRGNLEQAQPLQEQVVAGLSRTLGAEDWDTLDSMERLTSIYKDQGRTLDAADLQRKALASRRRKGEHRNQQHVLHALSRLASIYVLLERYPEAEGLAAESLKGKREFNGDKHPATLDAMRELAIIYWSQGEKRKAKALKDECVEGYERFMGKQHPSTLAAIGNLRQIQDELEPDRPRSNPVIHISIPQDNVRLHNGFSSDFLPAGPPIPNVFRDGLPRPSNAFPTATSPFRRSSSLNSGVRRPRASRGWDVDNEWHAGTADFPDDMRV